MSGASYATDYHAQRKITQFQTVYPQTFYPQFLGFPITGLGPEYYFKVNANQAATAPGVVALDDDTIEKLGRRFEIALEKFAGSPSVDGPAEETVESKSIKLLKANCVKCHVGETDNGFTLFNEDGSLYDGVDQLTKWAIFDVVDSQKMPKNGNPLTIEEINLLRDWARNR